MIAFACFFLILIIIGWARCIWLFFEIFTEVVEDAISFGTWCCFQVWFVVFIYMAMSYIVKWCGGDPSLFHLI